MPRKRYATNEALLQAVITDLEQEDHASHRRAVLALLSQGPLRCHETLRRELEQPAVEHWDDGLVRGDSLVRAELLAFLRELVRLKDSGLSGHGIWITGPIRFFAFFTSRAGHRLTPGAEGPMRDVVVQQLLLLLQSVGLRNVRACAAADCPHLYVKTYRREFCSVRCQKRIQARALRQKARLAAEHAHEAAPTRRRRHTKGSN
jgi:CGNR zinc finger